MDSQAIEKIVDGFILDMLVKGPSPPISSSSSSSSECDSSDEISSHQMKRAKTDTFIKVQVPSYSENLFKQNFKMNRAVAYKIIDRLEATNFLPHHTMGRAKVTAEKSFLLTIWYLCNTDSFRQVADQFEVSISTCHRILLRVVKFLLSLRSEYIKWPNSENDKKAISEKFVEKQGIRGVCGIIDACHVRINKLKGEKDAYVNKNGYPSILLQGVVDQQQKFIDIYCGEPGSLTKAFVLEKSPLFQKVEEDSDFFGQYFLLGDSAYPLLDWIIPPFKDNGALTPNQKIFNFKHSSTTMVIEDAFALLKGRFRRLLHFENLDTKLCVRCIEAACVLHNICVIENDLFNEEVIDEDQYSDDDYFQFAEYTFQGKSQRREQIFKELFSMS